MGAPQQKMENTLFLDYKNPSFNSVDKAIDHQLICETLKSVTDNFSSTKANVSIDRFLEYTITGIILEYID